MTINPITYANVSIDIRPDVLYACDTRDMHDIAIDAIRYFDENGVLHCDDGPAYVIPSFKSWWFHGKRHRLDGPAVVSDKEFEWWIDGVLLRCATVEQGSIFPQFNLHVVMHLLKCDSSIADVVIKLFLKEL